MNPIKLALGLAGLAFAGRGVLSSLESLHEGLREASPRPSPRRGGGELISRSNHEKTLAGPIRTTRRSVGSLDDRLAEISRLAHEGKFDPHVIAWTRKQLTRTCRKGNNGEQWCVPEKDTLAEIRAIFEGLRREVRYTSDIAGADTYQHPRVTLRLKTADCLPGETLLLTPQGLRPISEVSVGDTIHDGKDWVRVLNWWDKGVNLVKRFGLNNNCALFCTDEHKVFRVTAKNGRHEEVPASELEPGDCLLQPREFSAGVESLDPYHATIVGAYLAEGWFDENKGIFCIAGVPNGKGLRERVLEAAEKLGLTGLYVHPRYIGFPKEHAYLVQGCGVGAQNKRLPTLNLSLDTAQIVVSAMEAGDGGLSTSGTNMVYSTTSRTLALQYRVLKRMLGFSTSMRCLSAEEHGGAGSLPLWRITVRSSHNKRPWAKIKSIEAVGERRVYDIETTSGRIYLPESDLIVHNCDDFSSLACASLMAIGVRCRFKVIRTKDSQTWNHIYVQADSDRIKGGRWVSLDASVPNKFGWEAPASMIAASRVYDAY